MVAHTERLAGEAIENARNYLVVQGQFAIAERPGDMITTILGSCVATCMFDPVRAIGGMNHFLLPGDKSRQENGLQYGVNAMELLINALLREGAERQRLQAKVFGGANMHSGQNTIGKSNADFALWFLENENISCITQDVGGSLARKLRFWPANGAVQRMLVGPPAP